MCVCGGEKVSGCNQQQQQKVDVSSSRSRSSRRRSSQARAQLYSVSQPVGIRRPTQVSNLPFWLQAGFPFNNKIVLAKLAQIILTNTPSIQRRAKYILPSGYLWEKMASYFPTEFPRL